MIDDANDGMLAYAFGIAGLNSGVILQWEAVFGS
jgi:hypothetical protein